MGLRSGGGPAWHRPPIGNLRVGRSCDSACVRRLLRLPGLVVVLLGAAAALCTATAHAQASGDAGAEQEFLTIPTETFLPAGRRDDDAGRAVRLRAPLAPQRVFELPAPTRSEQLGADAAAGARATARSPPGVAGDAGRAAATDQAAPVLKVYRTGIGRDLGQLPGGVPDTSALDWVATPDGGLATALAVVSKGAVAVRVRLVIRAPPRGLEVRVYDAAGTPATVESVPAHQMTATAGGSVEVWTPTVPGETMTVELYLPPGTAPGALEVSVPTLSHLEADPKALSGVGRARCSHTDVACATDRISEASRHAVAKYVFTSRGGATYVCSGQLINDADPATQIPYFLTARHCVGSGEEASSMEFYWFFERANCGDPAPRTVTRQTGGATELAHAALGSSDTSVDHLLLRLNTDPPAGVGLAGWTTAGVVSGDVGVGVHHPAGDLKKINRAPVRGFAGWRHPRSTHTVVRPDVNTEGGSSGSGLWTRIDGADYLVGVLTGGSRGCRNATDYYGRFDRFYPRVSQWLGAQESVPDSATTRLQSRVVLVDAATRAEVADLTGGAASVHLDAITVRSFDIVAELSDTVGSVAVTLSGPRTATHSSDLPPYTAFGAGGGGGLEAGDYQVGVVVYAEAGNEGTRLLETEVPFTVAGSAGADMAVAGLSLAIGGGPRIIDLADDAAVTVYAGETVEVRARTSGGAAVGSVAFALTGAGTLSATENDAPFAVPAELVAGTYGIVATPYAAAGGSGAAGTALELTGVTVTVAAVPVTGFTLLDAQGELTDPDVGALSGGATVDLTSLGGWASVRANLVASTAATRLALALRGPRSAARTVTVGGVASLFGESGGEHVLGAFIDGVYTLTATPYAGPEPRDVLPGTTVAFTVTGGLESAVTGFTLIDAGGPAPDPDFAVIAEGATVDLRMLETAWASIRAELAEPGLAGSVRLELRGPIAVTRTANEEPHLLFGGIGDDVFGGTLPDGTYTLTARPFSELDGEGEALPSRSVSFTLADSVWPQTRVSAFTLVDSQGGIPDPDIGPIGQDATLYVPDLEQGEYSIRVDLSDLTGVRSVRLRLSGPTTASRIEPNDGTPFTMFGDAPRNGDVWGQPFSAGLYQAEATPFSERDGGGDNLVTQTVSFRLSGYDPNVTAATGFTLVDAGTDAAAAAIADGATLDTSGLSGGAGNIRVDIAAERPDVESVVFKLRGPRDVTRTDEGPPFSLFGDDDAAAADYAGSALPNGSYTLTARLYNGPNGGGDALGTTSVAFTVSGSHDATAAALAGLTLVDAAGAPPDPDMGLIVEGAILDMSAASTGSVSVRADAAARRADVESVVFELRGPRDVTHTDNGPPFSLFGDDDAAAADYAGSTLPNGAYTLTARPYAAAGGRGDALTTFAKSFTVLGSHAATAAPVTGFTLLDAADGASDADLGTLADGATLDLSSSTTGAVTVRAERGGAVAPDIGSMVFELRGPRNVDRAVDAGTPWRLFGPGGNTLPNGSYTLTARAYAEAGGTGDALSVTDGDVHGDGQPRRGRGGGDGVHAGGRGGRPAGSGSRRAGGRGHGRPCGHWRAGRASARSWRRGGRT